MEILEISNFAGIKNAKIEIDKFTVFIGHQASGKSVCAKLIYYFRQMMSNVALEVARGGNKTDIKRSNRENFIKYFPTASWSKEDFTVTYSLNELKITIRRKASKSTLDVNIFYSDIFDKILANLRKEIKKYQSESENNSFSYTLDVEGRIISPISILNGLMRSYIDDKYINVNYFVPAGRSFFSTIQSNVFSFISTNIDMDPFLIEFGRLYERFRNNYNRENRNPVGKNKITSLNLFHKIIKGDYSNVNGVDYINTSDDRSVPLASTSSGQQEALPLLILLSMLRRNINSSGVNLYIEEPEAHLFPDTQKELIDYIFTSLNANKGVCVLTTHSPYILSEINNMMYRGEIKRNLSDYLNSVHDVSGPETDPDCVKAYHFANGEVRSIIDADSGLINASEIDEVSNVIAKEFDQLVNLHMEMIDAKK